MLAREIKTNSVVVNVDPTKSNTPTGEVDIMVDSSHRVKMTDVPVGTKITSIHLPAMAGCI
jgi:hypothetical protein